MKFYHSRLFWRLLAPVVALFVVFASIIVWYVTDQVYQLAVRDAEDGAISTAKQFKLIRAYYTKNVVQKVLAASEMKSSFSHKNEAESIPLPATMIHDLSEELNKQGVAINLYSEFPFPNRKSQKLDSFQKEAWNTLSKEPNQKFTRIEKIKGKTIVRSAIADKMVSQGCVDCHNNRADTPKNDWQLGDVRGILEVQKNIDNQLIAGTKLSENISLVLIGLLLFSAVYIGLANRRIIKSRILEIVTEINKFSEGEADLTKSIEGKGKDEFDELYDAFQGLTNYFRKIVSSMLSSSANISKQTDQIDSMIAGINNDIKKQSEQTEELAGAVVEMSSSVDSIAESAKNASSGSTKAVDSLKNGVHNIEETVDAINQVATEMKSAMTVVMALNEESDSIGSVLDVIKGIAEQTNLLALNAAIEAARAGEQGRGFAVVADEVRTLASKTQASTEEIENMIDRLQSGAAKAATVIKQGVNSVSQTVEKVESAKEVIVESVSTAEEARHMSDGISDASAEQKVVTGQMENNAIRISDAFGASADRVQHMRDCVSELNTYSQELKTFVSKFKT